MDNMCSVWQKIDLHIHTDWSKKTKSNDYVGNFSIETLHEKLLTQGVQIFSLTDHNIINLPAYKEYYEKFNKEKDPLLLLGIELDIIGSNKKYHSLVIFNCSNFNYAEDINRRIEEKFNNKGLDLKERYLTFEEIVDIFPKDDFFFIPHAGNTDSIVDGDKDRIKETQEMLILLQSPLEKVPEKRRQIYNEGFDKRLNEAFKNKNDFAYIEFSDNHNIQEYPCSHKGDKGIHNFYYIKGSKNYETLRLAFVDPKSRIKSSSGYNSIINSRNYIEALNIETSSSVEDAHSLKNETNTHTKDTYLEFSPYLNVIIGGRSSGKSLLMDILNRSIDQLNNDYKYDAIASRLNLSVKSKFDETFKEVTSIGETSVLQINQGDIINYFEKNNLEDLARKTGKLEMYNNAKEKLTEKKAEFEILINNFNRKYKEAFESDVSEKIIIHNYTIEKYLNEEFTFKINYKEIRDLKKEEQKILDNNELLSSLIENVKVLRSSGYFTFSKEEKEIIKNFDDLIKQKKKKIEQEMFTMQLINLFLEKVDSNISDANSTLNHEGREKVQAQEAIKSIVEQNKKKFRALSDLELIAKILEGYSLSHEEEIEIDLEIKLCLEARSEERIVDLIIDGIKSNNKDLYECLLYLLYNEVSIKNYSDNKPETLQKKVNKQFSELFSLFDTPSDFLKYNDGTTSKNNSPGYNSEKYLQVILKNPNSNIILIDQPEDNLSNEFISGELVELIRDFKFSKQMFLVTHNPAIVVYSDAESIILAKNDSNIISYKQIKLEDESAQKEICSVLDCGEYIFDNRAQKYNIQKLLSNKEVN